MTFMERQSDLFHVKDLRVGYVPVPFHATTVSITLLAPGVIFFHVHLPVDRGERFSSKQEKLSVLVIAGG